MFEVNHLGELEIISVPIGKDVEEYSLQLAVLCKCGKDVFGELPRFIGWMNHPNHILSGKKPIELLETPLGFQWIHDELTRIAHGTLA